MNGLHGLRCAAKRWKPATHMNKKPPACAGGSHGLLLRVGRMGRLGPSKTQTKVIRRAVWG